MYTINYNESYAGKQSSVAENSKRCTHTGVMKALLKR